MFFLERKEVQNLTSFQLIKKYNSKKVEGTSLLGKSLGSSGLETISSQSQKK